MPKKEEERAHALLSASGAKRWLSCNPSARLEEIFEETESEYAKEGTLAHEFSEIKLRKYFLDTGMAKRTFSNKVKKIKANKLYKPEMDGYTDDYVDYVKSIAMSFENSPFIAIEQKVVFEPYVPESFGTADTVVIYGDRLYIIDLKYGKGVPVFAENNPQLMLYGLGAYLEFSMFYDIKDIEMHIVQPRLESTSSFIMSAEELLKWAEEEVKPLAQNAWDGTGKYEAGEQCRFCRAKDACKARNEKFLEIEKMIKDYPLLTNEEISEIIVKAEQIEYWAKGLKDYALRQVLKGEKIPRYKAVEGKKVRSFKNTDEAYKKLIEAGVKESLLYERQTLTLPQVEAIVGKKELKELVGDMVVMTDGKPTLVWESDKREEFKTKNSAEDDFSDIEFDVITGEPIINE